MIENIKNIKGLLIYPPTQLIYSETARPDGTLGLPYLASSLEQEGIKTDILDATVGSEEQTLKETLFRKILYYILCYFNYSCYVYSYYFIGLLSAFN